MTLFLHREKIDLILDHLKIGLLPTVQFRSLKFNCYSLNCNAYNGGTGKSIHNRTNWCIHYRTNWLSTNSSPICQGRSFCPSLYFVLFVFVWRGRPLSWQVMILIASVNRLPPQQKNWDKKVTNFGTGPKKHVRINQIDEGILWVFEDPPHWARNK